MEKWQHCKLDGNRVVFLGARGVFENKADAYSTQRGAWGVLEDAGWQLVAVVPDAKGELVYFFKRPISQEA